MCWSCVSSCILSFLSEGTWSYPFSGLSLVNKYMLVLETLPTGTLFFILHLFSELTCRGQGWIHFVNMKIVETMLSKY